MKLIYWILIIIASVSIPLIVMVVVPVIILEQSWWWFFGALIIEVFFAIVITIIFAITKLSKRTPEKIKLDIKDAKLRAINEFKYEEDNPDNFMIEKSRLERWGEKGTERTPILILEGKGSENNDDRIAIINLNNPKQEITKLINPLEGETERSVRLMAEHPPEEIREEITRGIDRITGMPITTTKIRRPTVHEKEKEEEEKKAGEMGGL